MFFTKNIMHKSVAFLFFNLIGNIDFAIFPYLSFTYVFFHFKKLGHLMAFCFKMHFPTQIYGFFSYNFLNFIHETIKFLR